MNFTKKQNKVLQNPLIEKLITKRLSALRHFYRNVLRCVAMKEKMLIYKFMFSVRIYFIIITILILKCFIKLAVNSISGVYLLQFFRTNFHIRYVRLMRHSQKTFFLKLDFVTTTKRQKYKKLDIYLLLFFNLFFVYLSVKEFFFIFLNILIFVSLYYEDSETLSHYCEFAILLYVNWNFDKNSEVLKWVSKILTLFWIWITVS